MLDKEFQYFIDNQKELVKQHKGKYIVIIGEKVVGAYDSEKTAYFESLKKYQEGTFLIQLCDKGKDVYTQTFHSRVVFN